MAGPLFHCVLSFVCSDSVGNLSDGVEQNVSYVSVQFSIPSLQHTTELIQYGGFAFLLNIRTNKYKNDHLNNNRPENLELATFYV